MTVHFSSDAHYGHKGVIEFCQRPWGDVERMDNALMGLWNSVVKPEDTIYVLGDFSFHNPSGTAKIAQVLNGKKILVAGNHDKCSRTQYLAMGFQDVFQELVLNLLGKRLRLSHYPYWPEAPENEPAYELRYPNLRPKRDPDEYLLHGHVHKAWKVSGRQINVGVDQWSYKPVSLSSIEKLIYQIKKNEPTKQQTVCPG